MKSPQIDPLFLLQNYLRIRLKKLNWTYKILAQKIGVSEVTVKRWLSQKKGFALKDFFNICAVLELEPLEFMSDYFSSSGYGEEYTLEQEENFYQNPLDLYIFIRLIVGVSVMSLEKQFSKKKLTSSLQRLESVKLIIRGLKGSIRILRKGPYRIRENGKLGRSLYSQFQKNMFHHFQQFSKNKDLASLEDPSLLRFFEVYLTSEQAYEFANDLVKVLHKYRTICFLNLEKNKKSEELKPYGGILSLGHFDFWGETILSLKQENET